MKTLTFWNPLRGIVGTRHHDFDSHNEESAGHLKSEEVAAEGKWSPPVVIAEDECEYKITANLPEISREKVEITVEDGVLSIQEPREHGVLVRAFPLPGRGDSRKMDVTLKDGILNVCVAKGDAAT